ncbi:hypothetical protein [Arthrobacter mobilis]|uniref:Uncharacterized protein n=1 Tax=Arthrobacter mobilis TaxID=2724944 RepID=A0A7X6HI14_9MICC|nr:hypothetical protein [Arthrobacter mobilis]NKX56282.1 hypothetical protein [Arthrobacter mobilis]
MAKITGKVARLLDERELVINRGGEHGVMEGMRFRILSDKTYEVTDPDDDDVVIGELPITKTVVKVIEVHPRMCVAKTFRTIPGTPGILTSTVWGSSFMGKSARTEEILIASDQEAFRDTLTADDLAVRVGDIAEEYKEN